MLEHSGKHWKGWEHPDVKTNPFTPLIALIFPVGGVPDIRCAARSHTIGSTHLSGSRAFGA